MFNNNGSLFVPFLPQISNQLFAYPMAKMKWTFKRRPPFFMPREKLIIYQYGWIFSEPVFFALDECDHISQSGSQKKSMTDYDPDIACRGLSRIPCEHVSASVRLTKVIPLAIKMWLTRDSCWYCVITAIDFDILSLSFEFTRDFIFSRRMWKPHAGCMKLLKHDSESHDVPSVIFPFWYGVTSFLY